MTMITLELPDGLAQKLQQLNQAELIDTLEKFLVSHEKIIRMNLLPPAPLPKQTFKISREAWYQQLLKISTWDEETVRNIEGAREYINQWQPKTFS